MARKFAIALSCLCIFSTAANATDDAELNRQTCGTILEFIYKGAVEARTRPDQNILATAVFKSLRSAQPFDSPVRNAFEIAQREMQRGASLEVAMDVVARACRRANPW